MKRLIVTLAVILAVVLLLLGALFLLERTPAESPEQTTAAETETVLFEETGGMVLEAVELSGSLGQYRLDLTSDQVTLEGFDIQYLDTAALQRAARTLRHLTGQEIENAADDLGQFGLTSPEASISLITSGEVRRLLVGNQMPGGYGRYVMPEGTNCVYLVYGLGDVLKTGLDFISTGVVSATAEAGFVPAYLRFGGAVRESPLELGVPGGSKTPAVAASQLAILSHHNYSVSYENAGEGLSGLFSIRAEEAVCYEPKAEDLTSYGLSEPWSTVQFSYADVDGSAAVCTLSASQIQDGYVFLMRQDVPVIYRASAASLPWLEWQYADLVNRFLLLPNIFTVSAVDVSAPGVSETYTLASEDNQLLSVTDSEGNALDTEAFKKFYQCLIGLPVENYTGTAPEANAAEVLRITYHYADGTPVDTVRLIQGPPLELFLEINGIADFYTTAKYADIITNNIHALAEGGQIVPLY